MGLSTTIKDYLLSLKIKFLRLIKGNHPNEVNIWVRKSEVKFKNKETSLFEFITPTKHYYRFTDKDYYKFIGKMPPVVVTIVQDNFKDLTLLKEIQKNRGFYLNGDRVNIDITPLIEMRKDH